MIFAVAEAPARGALILNNDPKTINSCPENCLVLKPRKLNSLFGTKINGQNHPKLFLNTEKITDVDSLDQTLSLNGK